MAYAHVCVYYAGIHAPAMHNTLFFSMKFYVHIWLDKQSIINLTD